MNQFRNVLRHRIDIATRWHGLRKFDDVYDFATSDPAVAALLADPQIQKQIMLEAIAIILDHADADPDGCRQKFGHEIVDIILAGRDHYLKPNDD